MSHALIIIISLMLAGCLVMMLKRMYRQVAPGQALIVNKPSGVRVSFTGQLVLPVIHRAQTMDIALKTITIARQGRDGLSCKDNIRADIRVTCFVRVNETEADVLRVAKLVGIARASDQDTIEELFGAKLSEALKSAGEQLEFEELYQTRQVLRDQIINVIGDDLNGYTLEDVAIDYLEQTPLEALDPKNIHDAEAIRASAGRAAWQRVADNLSS